MRQKLALIKLPLEVSLHPYPPLGIAYLSSWLKHNESTQDIDLRLLDLDLVLRDGYLNGLDITDQQGIIRTISEELIGLDCDLIGFTVYNSNARLAAKVVREIRTARPDSIIIIGGPFPTLFTDTAFRFVQPDFLVVGEGELTLQDLLVHIDSGKPDIREIEGIAYKNANGEIRINNSRRPIKNLDELFFPAFELLPLSSYSELNPLKSLPLMTARGCPNKCSYCSERLMWGGHVRFRSVENVIKEIERDIEQFKSKEILFFDSTFTINRERTVRILNEVISRGFHRQMIFYCQTRLDCIDKQLLDLMKRAGFHMISLGVETVIGANKPHTNKEYPAYVNNTYIKKLVNYAVKLGIRVNLNFIVGFPSETKEDLLAEFRAMKEFRQVGATLHVHLLTPEGELLKRYREKLIPNPTYYREFPSYLEDSEEPIVEIDSDRFIIPPENLDIDDYVSMFNQALAIAGDSEPGGFYL